MRSISASRRDDGERTDVRMFAMRAARFGHASRVLSSLNFTVRTLRS
jgi:hypothetical protein